MIEYFLTYLWTALDYVGATFLFDGFATRRFKRLAFWGITGSYILFESTVLNLIMPATANYRMVLFALIFYAIFYIVQYNSTVIFCLFMAVICYAISCCVDDMCYTSLFATVYKGNIIKNLIMDCQSYTKYRPNETTGGIFVSWRRKEELPTGA